MYDHRATCSCSVELYKLGCTLADFLSNWNISRGFLQYSHIKRSAIYVKICEFKKILSQKEIKGHKNTNAPLILKIWDTIIFGFGQTT
jgi:hypothetical protein